MDIQLQELLDKIRKEGLEAARAEAFRLEDEAKAKAAAIVAEAEKEAAALRASAAADAARAEAAGTAAISQAARDLVLAFRDGLSAALAAAVRSDVKAAYGPEVLAQAIPEVLKAVAAKGAEGDLELLVPPAHAAKLDGRFAERLSAELKRGVVVKPFPGIDAGFRIAERDGAAYYDFSADELAELLARRLNPRLAEAVRSAVKGL